MKEQIEKQAIEEMAKVIKSSLDGLGVGNFNFTGNEISTMFAKALYHADYRKQVWISVEERCPDDSDKLVLVCVSGTVGKHRNINLKAAYELATYNQEEGWILENYPEDMDVTVHAWLPLPEPPKMREGAE